MEGIRWCISSKAKRPNVSAPIPCLTANPICAHPETSGNPLVYHLTRPPDLQSPCEASLGTFDAARFTIQDVEILIVFPDSGFDAWPEPKQHRTYTTLQACVARNGFSGEIAFGVAGSIRSKKVHLRAATATVLRIRALRPVRRASQRECGGLVTSAASSGPSNVVVLR